MEAVDVNRPPPDTSPTTPEGVDASFWRGKRVFLTGHTGFKGSWLSLWLQSLGAEVCGFALSPSTTPALFTVARVEDGMQSVIGDVRDFAALRDAMRAHRPQVVLHLAAQPLVRQSYEEPVATYATNVMGTVHVLEAARACPDLRAIVNVTTDKCYENREWFWGYRESEPMGGFDPYSSSKGCSELVTAAYRDSFLKGAGIATGSARAGNVIGGGDWAKDRLIPDALRAFGAHAPVVIRHPGSIRPWQHVLDPLAGYLRLAEHLWQHGVDAGEAFNFGPEDADVRPVRWIVERLAAEWGGDARWELESADQPHEARYLKLDISKAKQRLGWRPRWELGEAIARIVKWERARLERVDPQALCLTHIHDHQRTRSSPTLRSESN